MRTAIVILNWNGRHHLERFLGSVTAHTAAPTRIIVADNGSTDSSLEFLAERYPQVERLRLDRNYGYAGGYNRALQLVDADCYVLLNSDVEVSEGWLEPLVAMLERDPEVAAVAPKILSYNARDTFEYAGASGGFIDILGYPFCRGRILSHVERDMGQYDTPREVFWASGAAFCCRADIFRRMGGFDADFFAHMEEIDLCWRMQIAGYKVMVEPRSRVYHLGGGTMPNESPNKLYLNYRNNLAMIFKCAPAGTTATGRRGKAHDRHAVGSYIPCERRPAPCGCHAAGISRLSGLARYVGPQTARGARHMPHRIEADIPQFDRTAVPCSAARHSAT